MRFLIGFANAVCVVQRPETVSVRAAHHGETQKECEGSLHEQQVRETICAVMEGGRKAFEDRYRRIALKGRHV